MVGVKRILIVGILVSIVVAFIATFILDFFNIGVPFIVPLIEGAVVGMIFFRLLNVAPNMSKNVFWALIGVFALVLYFVPQVMLYSSINAALVEEGSETISFVEFLNFQSLFGVDFGRIVGSSSIHLTGIGFWIIQLVEVVLYGFGILWGMQKSLAAAKQNSLSSSNSVGAK
jgi:hypothetical protein